MGSHFTTKMLLLINSTATTMVRGVYWAIQHSNWYTTLYRTVCLGCSLIRCARHASLTSHLVCSLAPPSPYGSNHRGNQKGLCSKFQWIHASQKIGIILPFLPTKWLNLFILFTHHSINYITVLPYTKIHTMAWKDDIFPLQSGS